MSVFGALNRFISRLDDAPQPRSSSSSTAIRGQSSSSSGFQVLRNTSAETPLEPWFDFIVGINGRPIDNPDPSLFVNEVRNCAGNSVLLGVWNAKGQRLRDFYLPVPADSPNLGLSLQWTPLDSTASVWHILEVAPNSPADVAGLLPYGDYIIGSPEGELRGEAGLGELVEEFLGRPLRLYVYNHEYNVTRTLTLNPARGWGGEGALGCVLGFGHLHQLPAPLEEGPPTAAGETMFESARMAGDLSGASAPGRITPPPAASSQVDDLAGFAMSPAKAGAPGEGAGGSGGNFMTPADMLSQAGPGKTVAAGAPSAPPMVSSTGASGTGTRRANRTRPGGGAGFDEMFAEGEKKSAETDNAPSSRSRGANAAPPPPPPGPPLRSKNSSAPLLVETLDSSNNSHSLSLSGSGTGTPKPETRSPDPITSDDDE